MYRKSSGIVRSENLSFSLFIQPLAAQAESHHQTVLFSDFRSLVDSKLFIAESLLLCR